MTSDALIPFIGIIGACIVAIANYLVQRWRYQLDRLASAVDNLCKEINETSNLATDYWLLETIDDLSSFNKAQQFEPQIVGRQMRIQQLIVALSLQDRRLHLTHVHASLAEFYDALSGGQFRVRQRDSDFGRAQLAQSQAAQLNGELMAALGNRAKVLI